VAHVHIVEHIFKGAHVLSALNLTVVYEDRQAEVLIQGLRAEAALEQNDAIRAEIRRLGEAIVEAAQSPQGITAGRQPPP
jgi:hypothetical protein